MDIHGDDVCQMYGDDDCQMYGVDVCQLYGSTESDVCQVDIPGNPFWFADRRQQMGGASQGTGAAAAAAAGRAVTGTAAAGAGPGMMPGTNSRTAPATTREPARYNRKQCVDISEKVADP